VSPAQRALDGSRRPLERVAPILRSTSLAEDGSLITETSAKGEYFFCGEGLLPLTAIDDRNNHAAHRYF